jgi:hypothetical protein
MSLEALTLAFLAVVDHLIFLDLQSVLLFKRDYSPYQFLRRPRPAKPYLLLPQRRQVHLF